MVDRPAVHARLLRTGLCGVSAVATTRSISGFLGTNGLDRVDLFPCLSLDATRWSVLLLQLARVAFSSSSRCRPVRFGMRAARIEVGLGGNRVPVLHAAAALSPSSGDGLSTAEAGDS